MSTKNKKIAGYCAVISSSSWANGQWSMTHVTHSKMVTHLTHFHLWHRWHSSVVI